MSEGVRTGYENTLYQSSALTPKSTISGTSFSDLTNKWSQISIPSEKQLSPDDCNVGVNTYFQSKTVATNGTPAIQKTGYFSWRTIVVAFFRPVH